MTDLFGNEQAHDTGSKRIIKLPPGVVGDAEFRGPNDCYRPRLRRWIGDLFPARYINFLAMNPSRASAHINDPTIAREWSFTTREGFEGMSKTNVCDYRHKDPSELLKLDIPACSEINLSTILFEAAGAQMIIVAFGGLNKVLLPHGKRAVRALVEDGHKLWCFDENADGSPKHPLYVKSTQPLRVWNPERFLS